MKRVFKDKPLTNLSLRRFEKPSGALADVSRRFCISIGLLQPGDSRDVVVDLFALFLRASKIKRYLTINEIYGYFSGLNKRGVARSNIRRNMLRLKSIGFIEKTGNGYRVKEWLTLSELFNEYIQYKVNPTLSRIDEYAKLIDSREDEK